MGKIEFRRLPATVQVPTGQQTIVCSHPRFALRMEIPAGMFGQVVTLRFYKPFKLKKVPDGWDRCGKVYEIRKFGPDANEGYRFFLEIPHTDSTGDDVVCHESIDDSDAGSWFPADGLHEASDEPDVFKGGRFEIGDWKFFANLKKEP